MVQEFNDDHERFSRDRVVKGPTPLKEIVTSRVPPYIPNVALLKRTDPVTTPKNVTHPTCRPSDPSMLSSIPERSKFNPLVRSRLCGPVTLFKALLSPYNAAPTKEFVEIARRSIREIPVS